jgi:hypothetical protein
MKDYKVETKIERDGSLTIRGLPFRAGERVQVIVRSQQAPPGNGDRHPLRGKPVRYTNPFGSVAEGDWEALK